MKNTVIPLDLLTVAYTEALTLSHRHNPELYAWPEEKLPEIAGRMMNQVGKMNGGYNISDTLKTAMKSLGMTRVTYRSINKFLQTEIPVDKLTEKGAYYYHEIIKPTKEAISTLTDVQRRSTKPRRYHTRVNS